MKQVLQSIFHKAAQAFSSLFTETKGFIAVALTVTGAILALLQKGGVIDILSIITPQIKAEVPQIEKVLAKAILILTAVNGVEAITQAPGQSDEDFLKQILEQVALSMQDQNTFALNAFWVKVASIMVSLLDGNKHPEHIYDTSVQMAISNAKNVATAATA